MKKSIALVAMAFGVTSAFAQDLTDKKGRLILPEAKDWGISIDASPFINLASDMVHIGAAATNTAGLNFSSLNDKHKNYSIVGKYFLNSTTAIRGIINIQDSSQTQVKYINKFSLDAAPAQTWPNNLDPDQVKDKFKSREWAIGIGGGIEKRKGTKYRLQGYYGGEATFILAGGGQKYSYGNDVVANTSATSAADDNIGQYTSTFTTTAAGSNISLAASHDERTKSVRNGKTFALAVRGFVGVEYFFTSKMSVGGEFGWGFGYFAKGRDVKVTEGLDRQADDGTTFAQGAEVVVDKAKQKTGGKERGFFMGSDTKFSEAPKQFWMNSYSPSGKLSFNFYF